MLFPVHPIECLMIYITHPPTGGLGHEQNKKKREKGQNKKGRILTSVLNSVPTVNKIYPNILKQKNHERNKILQYEEEKDISTSKQFNHIFLKFSLFYFLLPPKFPVLYQEVKNLLASINVLCDCLCSFLFIIRFHKTDKTA